MKVKSENLEGIICDHRGDSYICRKCEHGKVHLRRYRMNHHLPDLCAETLCPEVNSDLIRRPVIVKCITSHHELSQEAIDLALQRGDIKAS